jgi:hypothetical protein
MVGEVLMTYLWLTIMIAAVTTAAWALHRVQLQLEEWDYQRHAND